MALVTDRLERREALGEPGLAFGGRGARGHGGVGQGQREHSGGASSPRQEHGALVMLACAADIAQRRVRHGELLVGEGEQAAKISRASGDRSANAARSPGGPPRAAHSALASAGDSADNAITRSSGKPMGAKLVYAKGA